MNASSHSLTLSKLYVGGHSIPAGQNEQAAATGNNYPSVVAKVTGAALTNVAVGGSTLCSDNSTNRANASWQTTGGWITICAGMTANRSSLTDFSGNIAAPLQAVILMHLLNDLAMIGPPGQNLANKAATGGVFDTTFPPALTAVINRLRGGHFGYVWNGTDSGSAQSGATVFSSNWTKFTGAGITSSGYGAYPTAVGAVATLTLPTWYPGGLPVDLMFVGSLNNQGTFTIGVDGTTVGTADGSQILATSDTGTREQSPFGFRVPASALTAPGAHIITVTTATITGSGGSAPYFDSWTIEASTPPLIVLVKQYKLLADQSPSGNLPAGQPANYGVKNTDILAGNAVLDTIAAGYTDGRVISVDTDSIINQTPSLLQTGVDNLHPSIRGAGLIGHAIAAAIHNYYAANPLDLALTGKG